MAEIKRLRDVPQISAAERRALLYPELRTRARGFDDDAMEEASRATFGVTIDDIQPDDDDDDEDVWEEWEGLVEPLKDHIAMVELFARHAWDVTDEEGRPLHCLDIFAVQLWAAINGQYGARLPEVESGEVEDWSSKLVEAARKWRRP